MVVPKWLFHVTDGAMNARLLWTRFTSVSLSR